MSRINQKAGILIVLLVFFVSAALASASEEPWKDYDFGGETVRIQTRFTGKTPLGPRGAFDWTDPDPRLQAHIEDVEELFNCRIEFIDRSDISVEEMATFVLAGEDRFDIITQRAGGAVNLGAEGFVYALDDVLDRSYYDSLIPEFSGVEEAFRFAGKTFGGSGVGSGYIAYPMGIMWHQEMFEREGLPDLHSIYQDGEWTWETMRELGQQITKDTTGDGEIDQWGIYMAASYWETYAFAKTNNMEWVEEREDGTLKITLNRPEYVEALDFLREMYEEEILKMQPGNPEVGSTGMWVSLFHRQAGWEWVRKELAYGFVPYPMGPRATDYVPIGYGNPYGSAIPITTTKDPRGLFEVVSALWQLSEPYIDHMDLFADMEERQKHFWNERIMGVPDEESFEVWKWAERNVEYFAPPPIYHNMRFNLNLCTKVYDEVFVKERSPTAFLAENEPPLQALIDDIVEGILSY